MDSRMAPMTFGQKFAYSIGHVLNDLTASMWFTYMIIYFHQVKSFNNGLAGNLVLIGQISDALFTPFIGYESDRTKGCFNMGKRKTWHLVGTVCVMISFPFLFLDCITCSNAPDWSQFIYYIPFVVIFQFGWASTQINHLSLIPDLTDCSHTRVGLNGSRYAFTVLSNMAVYGIAWVLFAVDRDAGNSSKLGPQDASKFRMLVLIAVGIGILFTVIFHIGVKENRASRTDRDQEADANESTSLVNTIERSTLKHLNMSWSCWLKESQFYQVAVIYMSTRLVVNVSQVYLPMYLTESIKLDKDSIAIIPLVVYVSGFLTSLVMKYVNKLVGRKITYFIGVLFILGGSLWFYLMPKNNHMIYGAAICSGIGGSTMLVTSLAMTADLIGENVKSGAFVYGAMSFSDKLSNGVAIALIQQLHPCGSYRPSPSGDINMSGCCPLCESYYRKVMSFVPGAVCLAAIIGLLTLIPVTLGTRRKEGKVLLPVGVQNGTMSRGNYSSLGEGDDSLRQPDHSIN